MPGCNIKGGGCKNHTSPCSAISPALTKHSLLQILGPSRQHCHFVSVHLTLTSSHLNTRRKLAALSLSMKRPSSKPLVPAQEMVLTGRASLWKTTTKPPFMRLLTLHIFGEVLLPESYCLFAILLGQPGRLGDAIPLSCSPLPHHCMLDPSGGVVDNYVRLTNLATCTVQISPLKGPKFLASHVLQPLFVLSLNAPVLGGISSIDTREPSLQSHQSRCLQAVQNFVSKTWRLPLSWIT